MLKDKIDEIIEEIETSTNKDGSPMETFTPTYICNEYLADKKHTKLNWVGMHIDTFRKKVKKSEMFIEVGGKKYITKERLLDYIQKLVALEKLENK